MNDEQLLRTLAAWLKDSDVVSPDARAAADRARAQAPETPQRGRWSLAQTPSLAPRHRGRGHPIAGGSSLLSAMRLVVATAIVALFAGILLLSITSAPPDDVGTPAAIDSPSPFQPVDRLSQLEFEDVEPGVRRVVNDGVRELRWDVPDGWDGYDDASATASVGTLSAGSGGSVWVVWRDELVRLGDRHVHEWRPDGGPATAWHQLEVAPDGRLWHAYVDLVSYGSDGAQVEVEPRGREVFWDLDVQADGSVWALTTLAGSTLGRYGRDGWHETAAKVPSEARTLAAGDGDELWLEAGSYDGQTYRRLLRHVDGRWQEVDTPGDEWAFDVGADGTLWLGLFDQGACLPESCARGPVRLTRFDGQGWTEFGREDGVPTLGPSSYQHVLDPVTAPDGSVWLQPAANATVTGSDCAGVANFDGQRWEHYLTERCIYAMDVAPDGSLWALAGAREAWGPGERKRPDRNTVLEGAPAGPVELYVIGRIAGE